MLMLLVIMAALCVAALMRSDYKGFRAGRYVFKPLSALSFVLMALLVGAPDSDYGRTLLAGLLVASRCDQLATSSTN